MLIHAAGGGVGLLAVQLAKRAGARVLGTVSSPAKAEAVRAVGGETLEYGDDLAKRVFEATDGRGVDVVLDSVGRATQDVSLEVLARFGLLLFYGDASGPPLPIDPDRLYDRSLKLGAFMLDVNHKPERWAAARQELLRLVADGSLQLNVSAVLPLEEAAEAHRRLESRQSVGKILLTTSGAADAPRY